MVSEGGWGRWSPGVGVRTRCDAVAHAVGPSQDGQVWGRAREASGCWMPRRVAVERRRVRAGSRILVAPRLTSLRGVGEAPEGQRGALCGFSRLGAPDFPPLCSLRPPPSPPSNVWELVLLSRRFPGSALPPTGRCRPPPRGPLLEPSSAPPLSRPPAPRALRAAG